jgi:hypothetical protein
LLRHSIAGKNFFGPPLFFNAVAEAEALHLACRQLQGPPAGLIDWNHDDVLPLYQTALHLARLSHRLAQTTRCCDPELAWAAGLLAPLGWFASAIGFGVGPSGRLRLSSSPLSSSSLRGSACNT